MCKCLAYFIRYKKNYKFFRTEIIQLKYKNRGRGEKFDFLRIHRKFRQSSKYDNHAVQDPIVILENVFSSY